MFVRWFDSGADGEDADVEGESVADLPGLRGLRELSELCCAPGGQGTQPQGPICSATLLLTLLVTVAATALLVAAVITDHWEHVAWDRERLSERLADDSATWRLEWLLDGQVGRLLRRRPRESDPQAGTSFFLLPMNGGIWTLCATLSEEEQVQLQRAGLTQPRCVNYLSSSRGQDGRPSWQSRMQNLSISCALVCLIILGSSALVGAFGVLAHQTSAVLVTGVLYFLAATFALFTLTIIHFKRAQSPSLLLARPGKHGVAALADGVLPGGRLSWGRSSPMPPAPLWGQLLDARRVETAWSLQLGWGGVAAALLTAALWFALSKAMRGAATPPPNT